MSYHIVDSATKINNFEEEHSKKPMVIWYYADWCGHCTDMEPAWNDYKDKCKNLKVSLAKVNTVSDACFLVETKRILPPEEMHL